MANVPVHGCPLLQSNEYRKMGLNSVSVYLADVQKSRASEPSSEPPPEPPPESEVGRVEYRRHCSHRSSRRIIIMILALRRAFIGDFILLLTATSQTLRCRACSAAHKPKALLA